MILTGCQIKAFVLIEFFIVLSQTETFYEASVWLLQSCRSGWTEIAAVQLHTRHFRQSYMSFLSPLPGSSILKWVFFNFCRICFIASNDKHGAARGSSEITIRCATDACIFHSFILLRFSLPTNDVSEYGNVKHKLGFNLTHTLNCKHFFQAFSTLYSYN